MRKIILKRKKGQWSNDAMIKQRRSISGQSKKELMALQAMN